MIGTGTNGKPARCADVLEELDVMPGIPGITSTAVSKIQAGGCSFINPYTHSRMLSRPRDSMPPCSTGCKATMDQLRIVRPSTCTSAVPTWLSSDSGATSGPGG